MAVIDHVRYESAVRFRYGAVALLAAVTLVGSQLLGLAGTRATVSELTVELITFNHRVGLDMVGAGLDLIGLIAVGVTLNWLHVVTRHRRPELKPFIRWLVVGGAGLTALMQLAYTVIISIKAHQFVGSGNQSYVEASRLTNSGAVIIVPLLLELGTLLLAMACIWVSLNAMRAGLVTRLVGYAGVVAGALFIFPLGTLVPVIQGYWLLALALILAARWPSGDLAAWKSGEAVPWTPTQAQVARQQRSPRQRPGANRAAPERPSLRSMFGFGAPTPPPKHEAPKVTPTPRTGTQKRKRKRRS